MYRALVKAISYTAFIVILLWLLFKVAGVILLCLFAIILALVINSPVAKLEKRGMKRVWACMIVFGSILLVLGLMGWLIIPKVSSQITILINNLPHYALNLSRNVSSWFKNYPEIDKQIQAQGNTLSQWLPNLPATLLRIGNYSLSFIGGVLIFILFVSMVVYAVTNPRPLLYIYFSLFRPEQHEKATVALQNISTMLTGWIRANVTGGIIRGICITVFLTIMGVPGAFVWGVLAVISELIPKLGFYIMAIPPILMALSVSPLTALWVVIFMLALDEIMGDVILPKLRSNSMNIHPVSILFILLIMVSAFGFIGALLATPLTAIIKAYYEEFFSREIKEDKKLETRIDSILYMKKPPNPLKGA